MKCDVVFVLLEDNLIQVKSGGKYPRNIADFNPVYDLWYALKYYGPKKIIVLDNIDLRRSVQSKWFFLKLWFISEWLEEITKIPVDHYHSIRENWVNNFGDEGEEDIIDQVRRLEKKDGYLFIDRNTQDNKEFIEGKGIEYIKSSDFIRTYNPHAKNI
mgnify:FL=1